MTDKSFQMLACTYLQNQIDKLRKELDRVSRADNTECVHQSRVVSRRMRAGLNFFAICFSPKKTRKWLAQLRKLTKKLGAARDRDVQIEFIRKVLSNLREEHKFYKRGINRLLLRLNQSRQKLQAKAVKSIEAFHSGGMLANLHGEIQKGWFPLQEEDIPLQSPFVFRQAEVQIKGQLENLLSHQGSLSDPLDKEGHHQMRIETKKLRYTLEICDAAFEGDLKEIINAVKKIQTYLGDIHDYDVWTAFLPKFIAQEKQRTAEYFGNSRSFPSIRKGLEYLQNECIVQRDALFGEFVEHWNLIREEGLWDTLQTRIDNRLQEYPNVPEEISPSSLVAGGNPR